MPTTQPRAARIGVHAALTAVLAGAPGLLTGQGPEPGPVPVPRDDILTAMQEDAAKGYNLRVVTNASRLSTAVLLAVSRAARDAKDGRRLLLHHEDWYGAYQAVTGLPDDSIPEFMALQRTHGQDQIIDHDPATVRYDVRKGRTPEMVIRITATWPDGEDVPERYTFVDTTADPKMRVINERVITYYLLDFGDMIVQDAISGIGGRPTEGALGAVFAVIGDGYAVQSRFAISKDGLMVTYATARKGFITVNPVSTTLRDGTVLKGVPDDRPDLEAIVERLNGDLEVEYAK